MNPKHAVLALLSLACLALSFPASADTAPDVSAAPLKDAPEMRIRSQIIDKGEVGRGEIAEFVYEVSNAGSADLVLNDVIVDCTCTTFNKDEVLGKPIKPGQTAHLKVSVQTDKVPAGDMSKNLTVYGNDPRNPHQGLVAKARVIQRVRVTPSSVRFRAFKGLDKDQSQEMIVESLDGTPFAIEGAESSEPSFEVTLPAEARKPAKTQALNIALAEGADLGSHKADVTLYLTLPKQRSLLVPVAAELAGAVVVAPAFVDFGEVSRASPAPQPRVVTVEKRKGTDFVVKEATCSSPSFLTSLKKLESGAWEVEVTTAPPAGLAEGKLSATLTIVTNDADQPELRLPVVASVTR